MKKFLGGLGLGLGVGLLLQQRGGEERQSQTADRAADTARTEEWLEIARAEIQESSLKPSEILDAAREEAITLGPKPSQSVHLEREELVVHPTPDDELSLLNSASREDLMSVYGFGPGLADRIIAGRPYESFAALTDRGIVPARIAGDLKRELLWRKRTA